VVKIEKSNLILNSLGQLVESPNGITIKPVRAGKLIARMATSAADLDAAQALRYRVFYDEMNARPDLVTAQMQRDFDSFDNVSDHLLVVDESRTDIPGGVVGTYRLLLKNVAESKLGFYSSTEYDIRRLLAFDGQIMELGRSCVDCKNRNKPTMHLLWRAIAQYVFSNDVKVLFGCASLPGSDPTSLSTVLSYLHHFHLAPEEIRPIAVANRYVEMNLMDPKNINQRKALAEVPPLIKGYLRLGGFVGNGAVVDEQFNTTDVCVVVMTERVTEKYLRHYERAAHTKVGDK
tara:strand:+ start:5387 stop:6256 length:870 start_codon:yes stop_codon:yes gene_type:complete